MDNSLKRPDDLPEFSSPPLNEVVLGVQFNQLPGYRQIDAASVWELFKDQFPIVEARPPINPVFETFGLPTHFPPFDIPFNLTTTGVVPTRYWFMTPNGDELIQFQQDRLLHNWRKVGSETNEYPRFEPMAVRFQREIELLNGYALNCASQSLPINQCEISYINRIFSPDGTPPEASNWLSFLNFDSDSPDEFSFSSRRVIYGESDAPIGRCICETSTTLLPDGRPVIMLSLTVRGAPKLGTVQSAMEFLSMGREVIVRTFTELTTIAAHEKWGRLK